MGLMQRRKGRAFEQRIATILRSSFPGIDVRRSSQADRAVQSDVYCTGHSLLERLWLELQDARNPTPLVKLEQAERDVSAVLVRANGTGWRFDDRLPIVIWHRIREQAVHVTMRLWVLDGIRSMCRTRSDVHAVTMTLDDLLAILRERVEADTKCTCTYEVGSGGLVCTCRYGKRKEAS